MSPEKKLKFVLTVLCELGSGGLPSGHIYALLMGFMTLGEYNAIIQTLEMAKVIYVNRSHLITRGEAFQAILHLKRTNAS